MLNTTVTGLILSGGKSSRMGQDKGRMIVNEKPLIQWAIESLSPQVNECWINANDDQADYAKWGLKIIKDEAPFFQCGPLSGIYTALKIIQTEWLAVIPIDSPWIPPQFITQQLSVVTTGKINHQKKNQPLTILVAQENGMIEPMFSIIHRTAYSRLVEFLHENEKKSSSAFLLTLPHIKTIWQDKFYFCHNLNTQKDIVLYQKNKRLKKSPA